VKKTESKAAERDRKGRFASGNPGKPKGARHSTTLAIEQLLGNDARKLTRKAIELATAGDTTALRLCLERIAPVRRGRVVTVPEFPKVKSAADVPAALAALLEAVAKGDLTAEEAESISSLCARYVAAVEAADHEARLKALEERISK
jgi:hypothetical protein